MRLTYNKLILSGFTSKVAGINIKMLKPKLRDAIKRLSPKALKSSKELADDVDVSAIRRLARKAGLGPDSHRVLRESKASIDATSRLAKMKKKILPRDMSKEKFKSMRSRVRSLGEGRSKAMENVQGGRDMMKTVRPKPYQRDADLMQNTQEAVRKLIKKRGRDAIGNRGVMNYLNQKGTKLEMARMKGKSGRNIINSLRR